MLSIVFFLIAGEELSWGQRIFDLATPDYLSSVNEQDELNFHNINKRFFDRLLTEQHYLCVYFIVLIVQKTRKTLEFKIRIFLSSAHLPLLLFILKIHNLIFIILYVFLQLGFLFALKNKLKSFLFLAFTLMLCLIIIIIHTTYNQLFPWHNNSANELREFLFYLSCVAYAYEIMKNIKAPEKFQKVLNQSHHEKISLFLLLILHISLIGQTKDKFKNLFSVENIPSINVSTWFGFPAYFNKEDSEYEYSVAIMSTHPLPTPVYGVESRNSGPIGKY